MKNPIHPFEPGDRVATHPATDAFMRGLRYGTVIGRTRSHLHDTDLYGIRVRLDMTDHTATFHPDNLIGIDPCESYRWENGVCMHSGHDHGDICTCNKFFAEPGCKTHRLVWRTLQYRSSIHTAGQ